ncbi:protein NLP7-like [Solanum tuberosum]|uniref:protein NLP7-like n=1 Tax=Solanum tuberosum TaxID=4113 RepID=UPI00073A069B|nr:PREDICTED: protein NLP7-like [Solanum tuberosum]
MEHLLQQPSDVCDLMPCKLEWSQLKSNVWVFWSTNHNVELDYQQSIKSINSAASVVSIFPTEKSSIQNVMKKMSPPYICLIQFWAPIKVNESTFLSTADQPFAVYNGIDKRLSSYRKLCLDTLIPIDKEIPFGPPARVFSRLLPENNPDVPSYSAAEFPLLQTAIPLEIHSYYAFPVSNFRYQQCLGVFEIVSTQPFRPLSSLIKGLNFNSVGLYIPNSINKVFKCPEPLERERLVDIKAGLHKILERRILLFAQIWTPFPLHCSLKVMYRVRGAIQECLKDMYYEFRDSSEICFIKSGEALVGRAFASQGSCFCKDVTQLSIKEYPLVPGARKAGFTQSFAICLQSKCANNFICVAECFLPSNEMAVRDTKTFLNMLLSTMKEQLPGFIVGPGKEQGQRMLVEVVKVSPSDELDSFEIGQTLPSVQSLQDGGETAEIDSFCQPSNLQKENNVAAELLLPSCSSDKRDSLNCEGTVEVDQSLPHPIEEALTNRGTVNVDVAHDDHIKDTTEIMQLDTHFEQPNLETNSAGNATTNNEIIHSQKKNAIQRIEKDHGITRKILEQHYGMTLEDAAKNLGVSRATLKRICRKYEIIMVHLQKSSNKVSLKSTSRQQLKKEIIV